ncbi:unnamed protein product, partial [Amoebophrya sp. A120]|eukprot:GSA120T00013184001.1
MQRPATSGSSSSFPGGPASSHPSSPAKSPLDLDLFQEQAKRADKFLQNMKRKQFMDSGAAALPTDQQMISATAKEWVPRDEETGIATNPAFISADEVLFVSPITRQYKTNKGASTNKGDSNSPIMDRLHFLQKSPPNKHKIGYKYFASGGFPKSKEQLESDLLSKAEEEGLSPKAVKNREFTDQQLERNAFQARMKDELNPALDSEKFKRDTEMSRQAARAYVNLRIQRYLKGPNAAVSSNLKNNVVPGRASSPEEAAAREKSLLVNADEIDKWFPEQLARCVKENRPLFQPIHSAPVPPKAIKSPSSSTAKTKNPAALLTIGAGKKKAGANATSPGGASVSAGGAAQAGSAAANPDGTGADKEAAAPTMQAEPLVSDGWSLDSEDPLLEEKTAQHVQRVLLKFVELVENDEEEYERREEERKRIEKEKQAALNP